MSGSVTRSRFLDVAGVRIHCLEAGSSETAVMLLHGGGCDAAGLSWGPTVERLSPWHRVVAFDWPGYGRSPLATGPVTMPRLIEWLEAVRDGLGIERMQLVGISVGGGAALGYTLEHPEQVVSLTLVDSYGLQRHAPFHHLAGMLLHTPGFVPWGWTLMRHNRAMAEHCLAGIFHDRRAISPELLDDVQIELNRPHAGEAFLSFQRDELRLHGLRSNYLDRLGEIPCPALVIHGDNDPLVPVESAREAAARIPGAGLEIIEACGHWPQREHPGIFHDALGAFLLATAGGTNHRQPGPTGVEGPS